METFGMTERKVDKETIEYNVFCYNEMELQNKLIKLMSENGGAVNLMKILVEKYEKSKLKD
jgi:hypothetical protein